MTRRILFQIHWALGITAGLVLMVMGVTGAMMSFEDEIMRAMSPGIVTVTPPPGAPRLSPDRLVEAIRRQRPDRGIAMLTVTASPRESDTVFFERDPAGRPGDRRSYVDPYSGRLLGQANGQRFFDTVRALHRWLLLPGNGNGIGRQITAIAAISLIYFALSGLWLRWPRRPLDWRQWFVIDFRRRGRSLNRALHAVIGTWALLFYLLSGVTGLWWSYDWYRAGATRLLTGKAPAEESDGPPRAGKRKKAKAHAAPLPLAPAFAAILHETGGCFVEMTLPLPKGDKPLRVRVLPPGARHDRALDEYRVVPSTGAIVERRPYAGLGVGPSMAANMLAVHRGAYWGMPGRILLFLSSAAMPLFGITGWLLYLDRRRRKRELRAVETTTALPLNDLQAGGILIAYASQTGTATRLAALTAAGFEAAGRSVALQPLSAVTAEDLARAGAALIVASTYGDGEPPDTARIVLRELSRAAPARLEKLSYAVLALGDRTYDDFCAFGRRIDQALHAAGGHRLFDRIDVDREDAAALRHWQQQTIGIGATFDEADWISAAYAPWRLAERRCLNPGSPGDPAWHIALEPVEGMPSWQAGDIVEVVPEETVDGIPRTPVHHREYSIASLPASGQIELIVRLRRHDDGTPGLGSGWLTETAGIGTVMPARIRENPAFRPGPEDGPVILIGSGTGLAGLLAHLRDRAARGVKNAWLIFGERSREHDFFHRDEIEAMRADGTLARLDLAFSRDQQARVYVQHRIDVAADDIREWAGRGAAILVCGGLASMAPAVDRSLRRILGDEGVEAMAQSGRYRRDIY